MSTFLYQKHNIISRSNFINKAVKYMNIAIYSRKSKFTGKGDSIENQIEMCKQYIKSHIKGKFEFLIYEDEGFSGSTINRPEFQKLINDIKLHKIGILVCYRLDRISRNVADFSSTLEILQSNNVNFISIREQFDTSNPMGRAMIYIASVFAQLERETIAERVKDNMLELAKSGRWTGGKIPLGLVSKKKKYIDKSGLERQISYLDINAREMNTVKFLYNKYIELGSLHKLEVYASENEIKSKKGIIFEKSTLKIILQNPIYVKSNNAVIDYLKSNGWKVYGKADNLHSLLTYNKTKQSIKNGKHIKSIKAPGEKFAAVSNIPGAIEPELWLNVQKQFGENKNTFPRLGKTNNALLTGKLKCGYCKKYMLIQHGRVSKVTGEKLFYYVCSLKRKSHGSLCHNHNAKASEIEAVVLTSLKNLPKSKIKFIEKLKIIYNSRSSNNTEFEKFFIIKSISQKKNQIDNLVNILSKNQCIENIIIDKIKSLKYEYLELEKRLIVIDNSQKKHKLDSRNMNLIDELINGHDIIDNLPRKNQKQIIDNLISELLWFGSKKKSGKIVIKFVGYSPMLQFS